jgi:hypothetical protein
VRVACVGVGLSGRQHLGVAGLHLAQVDGVRSRLPVAGAKPRARGKRVLPPLPASVEAELAAAVEDAPDSLKAALRKLGRAVLSQQPENGLG